MVTGKCFCHVCGKEVNTKVVTMKETYPVFGEPVEMETQVLMCTECGEDLYCEELDSRTLNRVYAEYRRRHHLPMPENGDMSLKGYGGGVC